MVAEEGAAAAVVNLPHYQEAERPNSLGSSLMQQKQFQDALDTYTLAVNLAPAGPKSHVYYSNRSAAYLSLNMNERSIRDCVRSIALIKPTEEGGGVGGEYYSKSAFAIGLGVLRVWGVSRGCGRVREEPGKGTKQQVNTRSFGEGQGKNNFVNGWWERGDEGCEC
jgi:tetratricopeptide (TPR) repeat protein